MRVLKDYKDGIIDDIELIKTLTLIRNYLFRRGLAGVSSQNFNKLFAELYNNIFSRNKRKENYYDWIASYFKQIDTNDRFLSDLEFKNILENNDIYLIKKGKYAAYLLFEIENHNYKERVEKVDILSVEHIMPQTITEEWIQYLGGKEAHNEISIYLHKLGNLSLTGYNTEYSNKLFNEKKELIKKYSKFAILNEDVLACEKWDKEVIINRLKKLAKIALDIYKYPEPEREIIFNSNSISFTLNDEWGDLN